jgi:raffinose/stachyose/melibiose transport system permease protein
LPAQLVFLVPALALYGLFVLYPLVQSARYSLYDWNGFEPLTNFVGLGNFREAFGDPAFRAALRHNGIIIALSLVVQLPFALAMAVLLDQRLKGRALLRVLFFTPFVLSEVVTAVVWRQILRPAGMLDQLLTAVGGQGLIQEWLANPDIQLYSVFVVLSWKYFGFHMILMLAGLQQIPDELGEAAAIDGASAWQSFRYVTVPLLAPAIRVSVFLSVIGALQLFDMVWVLFGGPSPLGASETMATYLYQEFRANDLGYASALSMVIFSLSLAVALLYQRFALSRDLEGAGPGV